MQLIHSIRLAWRLLTHNKLRLLRSVSGIAFAVLLIFAELGFLNGLYDNQVELIEQFNADIIITNKFKHTLRARIPFTRQRLLQARALPEVEAAYPLYISTRRFGWTNPETRELRGIRVLAFNPDDPVFLNPDIMAHANALKQPDTVLKDIKSKSFFGRGEAGVVTELGGKSIKVVGTFRLGTDFANAGNIIMSDHNFEAYFTTPRGRNLALSQVDIGLVRVKLQTDPSVVAASLRRRLPDDVSVYTKPEYRAKEMQHWRQHTPIGAIFGLDAAMGFVIGVMICYQILYTDVVDQLSQFATMKAIGYHNRFLIGIVLKQALILSCIGFVLGLGISNLFYSLLASQTGLLMKYTLARIIFVFTLTIAMCLCAGGLAVRKLLSTDPATVF